ncbi:hypothetical protein KSS82_13325 [Vibrio mimicus]|nr:hypothetical protein [Vibrio mimicus]QXC55796.1 hypothetical protein KSS82_00720 [Vibrio mimicus]QXC55801.1 hypothetical protein KSS82_00745 [Vibrio mimicus]QXC55806.1 hypothetical protein KSS82_00770 [Vibrio mimicus]QXC56274.1 hypothetical protein KSS82_13325 [Vibrio mimicus]
MSVIEDILRHQLSIGFYDNVEPDFARGLAQRAVDHGFSSLSERQQDVLSDFLTQTCSGVTDPGGHHNNCTCELSDAELLQAYREAFGGDDVQCEDCREEASFHSFQRDRLDHE